MTETAVPAVGAPSQAPVQDILALQQTAGNQAVARMIAGVRVARDATKAPGKPKAPPKKGGEKPQPAPSGLHVKIAGIEGEGPGGAIEALSFRLPGHAPGAEVSRPPEGEKEVSLTAKVGIHSPKLNEAVAQGRTLASAEILMLSEGKPYMTIRMKSVAVTSYSTSGGGEALMETFHLLAGELEFELESEVDDGA